MSDTHYTATLEVTKTEQTKGRSADDYGRGKVEPSRDVANVARIVVRADDLAALRDKLVKHVELIDE